MTKRKADIKKKCEKQTVDAMNIVTCIFRIVEREVPPQFSN